MRIRHFRFRLSAGRGNELAQAQYFSYASEWSGGTATVLGGEGTTAYGINDAGQGVGEIAVTLSSGVMARHAVALYARMHGASGQKVASSLAQGSTFHQGAYFAAEAQASDEGPDASRNEYGMNAVYRFYRASDDWFFLAARDQDLAALVTAVNDPVVSEAAPTWQDPGGDLARALVEAFAGKSAKDWVTVLDQAGIAVQVARSIDEAISYLVGRGLVYFEPGVNGQPVACPEWATGCLRPRLASGSTLDPWDRR